MTRPALLRRFAALLGVLALLAAPPPPALAAAQPSASAADMVAMPDCERCGPFEPDGPACGELCGAPAALRASAPPHVAPDGPDPRPRPAVLGEGIAPAPDPGPPRSVLGA